MTSTTSDFMYARTGRPFNDARRRGPTEIIAEILATASDMGTTKTSLVYRTNMNFLRIKKYLDLLIGKQLLECLEFNSHLIYRTTRKGQDALKGLRDVQAILYGSIDLPIAS